MDPAGRDELSRLVHAVRQRAPARLLTGRVGGSYSTATQLALRADHATARDAVLTEIDLQRDLGGLAASCGLFETQTQALSKAEYLRFPNRGRLLNGASRQAVGEQCPTGTDLQIVVGDGLSAQAVVAQVPTLLPLLLEGAISRGWMVGRPFFVRYCRVGVLNDIGPLLDPQVVVLLIGERPGLATAESLSAYFAWQPRPGHTDAQRNLISNIHAGGVPVGEAVTRILELARQLRSQQTSGVAIKENLQTGPPALPRPATKLLP